MGVLASDGVGIAQAGDVIDALDRKRDGAVLLGDGERTIGGVVNVLQADLAAVFEIGRLLTSLHVNP